MGWSFRCDSSANILRTSCLLKSSPPFHPGWSLYSVEYQARRSIGVPSKSHFVPERVTKDWLGIVFWLAPGISSFPSLLISPQEMVLKRIGKGCFFNILINWPGVAPVHIFCMEVTPKYTACLPRSF